MACGAPYMKHEIEKTKTKSPQFCNGGMIKIQVHVFHFFFVLVLSCLFFGKQRDICYNLVHNMNTL
jgi:hypothetical protein